MLEELRDLIEFKLVGNKVLLTTSVLYGDSIFLGKEQALELVGELYELVESIPEVLETTPPFKAGECLGKEGENLFPEEILEEMKEKWLNNFSNSNHGFVTGEITKEEYDPEKHSKLLYQNVLLKQICDDIRNDDGEKLKEIAKRDSNVNLNEQ